MVEFVVHLVVTAALLMLVANLVDGVKVESWGSAFIAAIVLGLVFLAGGAAIPALGEERTEHMVTWWLARSDGSVRLWCALVMLTGGAITWLASPGFGGHP